MYFWLVSLPESHLYSLRDLAFRDQHIPGRKPVGWVYIQGDTLWLRFLGHGLGNHPESCIVNCFTGGPEIESLDPWPAPRRFPTRRPDLIQTQIRARWLSCWCNKTTVEMAESQKQSEKARRWIARLPDCPSICLDKEAIFSNLFTTARPIENHGFWMPTIPQRLM